MKITINAKPKEIHNGDFNYSNIESEYGCNTLYFTKNGKPYSIIAGEMHFARVPKERWKETLLKMRECGVNTVSTYVFWNYHEEIKGQFDFSGNKDIAGFLQLCKEIGMLCILRIGPWCHGEVVYGGFPKRINKMKKKRTDAPEYLAEVKEYWQGLYKEVAPYLDGKTVIGIQIDNEYTGPVEHLLTLRKLAEEIGYKAPFFTMTAWLLNKPPDNRLLPLSGGYPDGPWNVGKKELKPNNRFAITSARTEDEIGGDLFKRQKIESSVFDYIPYGTCETGPGNQVSQHRRPFISEKDGYGVGFAKFASGMNWLGYYMFCGGANPNDRLMQESKLTGYPNDYPIIDYDFQAPISRYGACRAHGDRLRLMHLFISDFDTEISTKQAYFPKWNSTDPMDISFLKCSVRADNDGSGYFFAGAYEKGLKYNDFKDVQVDFSIQGKTINLPSIDVKAGAMFFYPFNIQLGSVQFDYILAQPVAKTQKDGKTVCYFVECEGIEPKCSINGKVQPLALDEENIIDDVTIYVISYETAKRFHFIAGKPYFLDGTVYCDNGKILCEQVSDIDLKNQITLAKTSKRKLPYNHYLLSTGKRCYYELKLPENILKEHKDVVLEFDFDGLNLQVFSGNQIINDYFNIDRKFIMNLRDYKEYIEKNSTLIIRTAPKTKFGVSNVYNEIEIPLHSNALSLSSAKVVKLNTL